MKFEIKTTSKEETQKLGETLAKFLSRGDVILLSGDLGAGKTTFTGGVAKGLNIEDDVISPTFNILKCYFEGTLPLYHIDAYRLENQNIELGLDEYIEGDGVCFIEWPQFIEPLLPDERLEVKLFSEGDNNRRIEITSIGEHFDSIVKELSK